MLKNHCRIAQNRSTSETVGVENSLYDGFSVYLNLLNQGWAYKAHFLLKRTGVRLNDTLIVPVHIRQAIEAACKGAEVSLIDLGVRGMHRQMRLEISIDSTDGITHEHCRAVSRLLEERLKEDEFYDRLQAVDVSSPGAETPVRFLWQLSKHVGRTVRIVRTDSSVAEGILLRADDSGVDVSVQTGTKKNAEKKVESIPADNILEARTVLTL
ncbi:MAG: Ribosome maturation factor RimP [Chlorobi bacterium]|nr:Ribosome maturation factor RimP [Chlorobiota bacterium]